MQLQLLRQIVDDATANCIPLPIANTLSQPSPSAVLLRGPHYTTTNPVAAPAARSH
jgi:hypothetical protein